MKVVPVVDVLENIVVHAVQGERRRYRPLKSILCRTADPEEVACTFESLGFDSLYLADLDAISGKPANFPLYKRIKARTNLDLMVDAGIADVTKAKNLLRAGVPKIVIGTETLSSLGFVKQAVRTFGEKHVVVSIDLKKGEVMSASEHVKSMNPVLLAQTFENIGVSQTIFLDLDRVGTERGANVRALKEVLKKTKVKFLVGGGIRNIRDLEEMRSIGVVGVLVATALHNGKLKVDELKSADFLQG